MKLTKPEKAAILIAAGLILFVAGFFTGRTTAVPELRLVSEAPAPTLQQSVPSVEPASPGVQEEIGSAEEIEFPLNLNAATKEQLEALPGIGEALAQRILDYRQSVGGFSDKEELKNVSGIGEKTYEEIKALVEVR